MTINGIAVQAATNGNCCNHMSKHSYTTALVSNSYMQLHEKRKQTKCAST